jgi:hypothetical protein
MKLGFYRVALACWFGLAAVGCKTAGTPEDGESGVSAAKGGGKSLSLVGSGKQTTHYCSALNALPPNQKQWYNPKMGPGYFSCTNYNSKFNDAQKQTGLYIALSDQIQEINWCNGSECSVPNGGFCGKQVRVSCRPERGDQNCNSSAQPLVVTVADFCPVVHPDRKSGQKPPYCGDGQTVADISDWVWDHFRSPGNENNLKLTFEKVGW